MRIRIVLACVATLGLAAASVWLTVETRRNRLVWDHFDVVKPGILYRSGQLTGDQLEDVIRKKGLRTVISFQIPGKGVEAERAVAKRMKVDFLNLPMSGDGFGKEEQFREVLTACDDPDRRPVLIHCARGTCRTGAAVALYRFERDGWTIADVQAEMSRQVYRNGWLAGYVFGMLHERPGDLRVDSLIKYDRNLPAAPKPVADAEPDSETETEPESESLDAR